MTKIVKGRIAEIEKDGSALAATVGVSHRWSGRVDVRGATNLLVTATQSEQTIDLD